MSNRDLQDLKNLTQSMHRSPTGFFGDETVPTSVLLVDPDTNNRCMFKDLAERHLGVFMYTSDNAEEAIEVLEREHSKVAVAVVAQELPGDHDGCWLVDESKKLWPDILCILTAECDDLDRVPQKVDDIICKPWDIKHLVDELNLLILKAASGAA